MTVRALGANSRLRLKKEVTYATSPGGNFSQVPFNSMDFNPEQKLIANDTIGNGRDPLDPGRDMVDVVHSFKVPVDVRSIGHWLTALFGAAVDTGAGPYTHTWTSGGAPGSYSIEAAFNDVAEYFMKTGAVLGSLKFPFQTTGMLDADGTLIGQNDAAAVVTGAGTPTTETFTRFSSFEGSIKRNTVVLAGIESADLTYDNHLEAAKVIRSDGLIDGVDPTVASCVGSITSRFMDTTLLTDASSGTPIALALAYTIDANTSLTFNLPRVFLPRPKASVANAGGVRMKFDWQASFDSVSGYMLQVVLKNDVATY